MRFLLAWICFIIGSFFMGIGQKLSEEAHDKFAELVAEQILESK